jgi:hypothetical protein
MWNAKDIEATVKDKNEKGERNQTIYYSSKGIKLIPEFTYDPKS